MELLSKDLIINKLYQNNEKLRGNFNDIKLFIQMAYMFL
jgi:hypothetical protein